MPAISCWPGRPPERSPTEPNLFHVQNDESRCVCTGPFPYAAAIDTGGQAEMIAARPDPDDEHPKSADVLDACVAALVSQRDYIRAGAVAADVRLPDSDAIRVELEHADGHALTVLLPYSKKRRRRGVDYGPLRAQAGSVRIWT